MIDIISYQQNNLPSKEIETEITNFLFKQLEQYGDPIHEIQSAMDYALGRNNKTGGLVLVARESGKLQSALIINLTGMEPHVPPNILVYIATDKNQRGRGIGKKMMQTAIEKTEGDIALHVEPHNPAKKLYENLGFTNKYLEMRLIKSA